MHTWCDWCRTLWPSISLTGRPSRSQRLVSDRPPAVVAGNRVVATSRIVGYDEAPLTGRQWRTYTLTDFTRADIEQFVTQWTLAFTRSIQGDTAPARQAAAQERRDLLQAIFHNPSVERLAANPLLLTILALIKHTGVTLPEQRVKLYELYLQTLIESWNRARSLDQYPVGETMRYEETVQVLGPAGPVAASGEPYRRVGDPGPTGTMAHRLLPRRGVETPQGRGAPAGAGLSRQRATILEPAPGERGERWYGFLHLTLEEMLAAQGIVQRMDASQDDVLVHFRAISSTPPGRKRCNRPLASLGSSNGAPESPWEDVASVVGR